MEMQKMLFDDDYKKSTSELVRDVSYLNNQNIFLNQREFVKKMLLAHPEGITDQEIAELTGFSLSSVNARRNECNAIVVGIANYEDENGNNHLRCMWGLL